MAIIALTAGSGSPGVSTTTVGLALCWPRPVVLVEADPTGGSGILAGYFQGQVAHDGGLIELAMAQREDLVAAELPHQLFTRCCGRVLCRSQLRYRLGIKALLPRPLQLVEIACLLHAARQFRTGLGRRIDLLRILQALLSGHRPHPGLAHLGDLVNHGGAELNLGLCNLALCDGLTSRQGQQLQQTKGQQAADLQLVAQAHALKREHRIRQLSGLLGLGHVRPALGQQGLHRRAVGQRELNGLVHTEGLRQQICCKFGARLHLFLRAAQLQLALRKRTQRAAGIGQGLVKVDGGTAGQDDGRRCDRTQSEKSFHGVPVKVWEQGSCWARQRCLALEVAVPPWRRHAIPRLWQSWR